MKLTKQTRTETTFTAHLSETDVVKIIVDHIRNQPHVEGAGNLDAEVFNTVIEKRPSGEVIFSSNDDVACIAVTWVATS